MSNGARVGLAVIAVVTGAVLLTAAVARAVRMDVDAGTVPAPAISNAGVSPAARTGPGGVTLLAAADRNPFHPERRRGGVYRLPGEEGVHAVATSHAEPSFAPIVLVGTAVVGGGRDFVVCRAEYGPARIVRQGAACGPLLLVSVEQSKAKFTDPTGRVVVIEVLKAGSQ